MKNRYKTATYGQIFTTNAVIIDQKALIKCPNIYENFRNFTHKHSHEFTTFNVLFHIKSEPKVMRK